MSTDQKPAIRTPLQNWHMEHGAYLVAQNGWQLPAHYGSPQSELAAAREGIGLADISACAKLQLDGQGVRGFASEVVPAGSLSKPGDAAILDCDGPVVACRLTDRSLLLTGAETAPTSLLERFMSLPETVATDLTMALAAFTLVGPSCETLLRRLTALDLSIASLPAGKCAESSLAGVHALLVRPPRSTFIETQLFVAADVAEYLWEKLLHVGREFGIVPLGIENLVTIRSQTVQ
jgi:glycine cleavage system aminomethyltransferase T